MSKRTDYGVIKVSFENKEFELLTTNYINNKQKLEYICPNGHRHRVSWADWNSKNVGCPYCNGRPIITLELVRQAMAKEGYILLTKKYINNKQRLDYICPEGHFHHTTWAKWNSHGYRCPYCYGNAKKTIEEVRRDFEKYGYVLVTEVYINGYTKLHSICPNGHDYFVSWDNWSHNKSRCPKCNIQGVSKEEIGVFDFVKSIYPGVVINNDYSLITPKEIDITIPDKKLAIEYCGLYWHSELMGKNKHYHVNKLNGCRNKDYTLMTIFSDEWRDQRDIVLSRLKDFFGCDRSVTIDGKHCSISEITSKALKDFCNQNDFKVPSTQVVKIGAFYKEKLVSIITFKRVRSLRWEMLNFCSKLNYHITGDLEVLLTYFQDNFKWKEIFIDVDRRWPATIDYCKSGFEEAEIIEPCCWYIKRDRRVGRVDQNSDELEKKNLNKIWDCGYLRYIKRNKDFQNTN